MWGVNRIMFLSILLTNYNQMELLRRNIREVCKCRSDDIEIVVSDNCSEEPIERMLSEFDDNRIRYCKTAKHGGQDANILNGIRNCRGEYIFLFRTKDILIPEAIEKTIQIMHSHPSAVYFMFSSLDENGEKRLLWKDKIYMKGEEAQQAHERLLIHPSGQIYKRSMLRPDTYENYINDSSCSVHQLIRMDLALQGDFVTSSLYNWKYAYTLRSTTVSANQMGSTLSIYAPFYEYQRYGFAMSFIDNELPEENRGIFIRQLIKHYSWSIVPGFLQINCDKAYNSHYNSRPIPFFPYKELKHFKQVSEEMLEDLQYTGESLRGYLQQRIYICAFWSIPKAYVKMSIKKLVYNNKLLANIWQKVRKIG